MGLAYDGENFDERLFCVPDWRIPTVKPKYLWLKPRDLS